MYGNDDILNDSNHTVVRYFEFVYSCAFFNIYCFLISKRHAANVYVDEELVDASNDVQNNAPIHEDFTVKTNQKTKKKLDFINERVVSALDAAQISDYKGMHIISAVAEALGHSLDDLAISRTTLNRIRKKNRETIANRVMDNFEV